MDSLVWPFRTSAFPVDGKRQSRYYPDHPIATRSGGACSAELAVAAPVEAAASVLAAGFAWELADLAVSAPASVVLCDASVLAVFFLIFFLIPRRVIL